MSIVILINNREVVPIHAMEAYRGTQGIILQQSFLNLALDEDEW
jgi:hypothetical protein